MYKVSPLGPQGTHTSNPRHLSGNFNILSKFLNYVKAIGINSEGNTKRITCNDVKNYYI